MVPPVRKMQVETAVRKMQVGTEEQEQTINIQFDEAGKIKVQNHFLTLLSLSNFCNLYSSLEQL